jgi:hypothetical protein
MVGGHGVKIPAGRISTLSERRRDTGVVGGSPMGMVTTHSPGGRPAASRWITACISGIDRTPSRPGRRRLRPSRSMWA